MCPNIRECWEEREATFLILGTKCTRRCGFCDVMTAKPDPVDEDEPARIAEAVREMGLRYVVLTGVARDDLEDGGARIWASAIRAVREAVPGIGVEVLPSDFKGGERDIGTVLDAEPDVFAHNLETVRRLHDRIRPAFGYDRSLEVLRFAKRLRSGQVTKSNLILGMGERPEEVPAAMADLRDAGIDILTMGQYLQPTTLPPPGRPLGASRRVRELEANRRGDGDRPRRGGTARQVELPRREAAPACGRGRRRRAGVGRVRATSAARAFVPAAGLGRGGRTVAPARRRGELLRRPRPSTTPAGRAARGAPSVRRAAGTSGDTARRGPGCSSSSHGRNSSRTPGRRCSRIGETWVAPASIAAPTTSRSWSGRSEIPGRIGAINTPVGMPPSVSVRIASIRARG